MIVVIQAARLFVFRKRPPIPRAITIHGHPCLSPYPAPIRSRKISIPITIRASANPIFSLLPFLSLTVPQEMFQKAVGCAGKTLQRNLWTFRYSVSFILQRPPQMTSHILQKHRKNRLVKIWKQTQLPIQCNNRVSSRTG
jgi:hypothetical protein